MKNVIQYFDTCQQLLSRHRRRKWKFMSTNSFCCWQVELKEKLIWIIPRIKRFSLNSLIKTGTIEKSYQRRLSSNVANVTKIYWNVFLHAGEWVNIFNPCDSPGRSWYISKSKLSLDLSWLPLERKWNLNKKYPNYYGDREKCSDIFILFVSEVKGLWIIRCLVLRSTIRTKVLKYNIDEILQKDFWFGLFQKDYSLLTFWSH